MHEEMPRLSRGLRISFFLISASAALVALTLVSIPLGWSLTNGFMLALALALLAVVFGFFNYPKGALTLLNLGIFGLPMAVGGLCYVIGMDDLAKGLVLQYIYTLPLMNLSFVLAAETQMGLDTKSNKLFLTAPIGSALIVLMFLVLFSGKSRGIIGFGMFLGFLGFSCLAFAYVHLSIRAFRLARMT